VNLRLEGANNRLQNGQGQIIAGHDASLATGALSNNAGLIAAVDDLHIDTGTQSLSNLDSRHTSSTVRLGLLAGKQIDIASGALDNRAGLISAQTTLNITSSGAVNNAATHTADNTQASQIYSGGNLTLQAIGVDNTASQILAVGDASLNTAGAALTTTAGLIRVGQALTIQAGNLDNTLTQAFNSDGSPQAMGLEANHIAITTANLNNTQGAVRAVQNLSIRSDGHITNDQGQLSAGQQLHVTSDPASPPSLRISNASGQIVADQSINVRAASLSGAGTIASSGDLDLSLQGDHTLAGSLQAGRHLQLQTTGTLTNPIAVQAGQNLSISADRLDNQASGELLGGRTTQLNVAHTLTNRGLINGTDTRIQAETINNLGTGRIYGDRVALGATTLNNREENLAGTSQAATIAGRARVDIGATTLVNQANALVYSGGDLAIGGALDGHWQAAGTAQNLSNTGASIQAQGKAWFQTQNLSNNNAGITTGNRVVQTENVTEYVLDWEGKRRTDATLLPQYGSIPCNPSSADGGPVYCGGPVNMAYFKNHPAQFGTRAYAQPVYDPQCLDMNPDISGCTPNFTPDAATYQRWGVVAPASKQDPTPALLDLDHAIASYNAGVAIDNAISPAGHYYEYQYTRTTTQTQVLDSHPGTLIAGGDLTVTGHLLNDKSLIVAGGAAHRERSNRRQLAHPEHRHDRHLHAIHCRPGPLRLQDQRRCARILCAPTLSGSRSDPHH
jgi:adhesin HecA-like repeat protein